MKGSGQVTTDDSSAAGRAYRHLRDAILEGGFAPGQMLGESGLAEDLGMSRTP
ncbi:MAG: GntR family transcriptional regulator, partial [Brevibacterium yomogidense]